MSANRNAVAFAPGRVNVIGEHTDYNQGLALPFAIELGVTVRAEAIAGSRIEAVALDLGASDSFDLRQPPKTEGWRAYVRGAAAELQREGIELRPARLEISADLPRGAGLASSGALEIGLCLAMLGLAGVEPPPERDLARIGMRIENDWVGAQAGLLDQLASLCGQPERAIRIDFRSLKLEHVPLALGEHRLVTLDSGERHTNAASGYNARRAECARACELLGIQSLRDADLDATSRLSSALARRVRHVVSENDRVEHAITALRQRDWEGLGELLDASHASLRDDYEVSTPAVESAVSRFRRAGALGARIVGGGFGGHVLGLMPPGRHAPDGALDVRPGRGARLLQ